MKQKQLVLWHKTLLENSLRCLEALIACMGPEELSICLETLVQRASGIFQCGT
jgi:hypothetical protein